MKNLFNALCGDDAPDTEANRKSTMDAVRAYAKAKCMTVDQVKLILAESSHKALLADICAHWVSDYRNKLWQDMKSQVRNNALAPPHHMGVTSPWRWGDPMCDKFQPWKRWKPEGLTP